MAHIEMTGKIPVVYGFHKLFEFVLGLSEKAVKISELPGYDRNQDDEIDILSLNNSDGSQAKNSKHEYNANDYAKLESFKHFADLSGGPEC